MGAPAHCMWDETVCANAAYQGTMDMLKWVQSSKAVSSLKARFPRLNLRTKIA